MVPERDKSPGGALIYPTVSQVGVHVATLENPVAIVVRVVGAGD